SQYTSFVAVDAKQAGQIVDPARPPRRMLVPVPLPEGTRWEGFFGEDRAEDHPFADSKDMKYLRSSLATDGTRARLRPESAARKSMAYAAAPTAGGAPRPTAAPMSNAPVREKRQLKTMVDQLSRRAGVANQRFAGGYGGSGGAVTRGTNGYYFKAAE